MTIGFLSHGQEEKYPKGVYMSFEEVINKSPSKFYNLLIEKRSKSEIRMQGGNDYRLFTNNNLVKIKVIKKDIWAYSDGENLYLNGWNIKIQHSYVKVESDKNYFVFIAGLPNDYLNNSNEFGLMFGAIVGGISAAKRALLRYNYIFDKNTQRIKTVTSKKMENLLFRNPDVLTRYKQEKDKSNIEIIKKYLIEFNEL